MTKIENDWIKSIVQLGCVVCRNLGYGESPAEVHHIRSGVGKGQRASHIDSIPLCPSHHRLGEYAFHSSPRQWQQRFGSEYDLLRQTRYEVAELIGRTI